MFDVEAFFPFPAIALIAWPIGMVTTAQSSLSIFAVILAMSQFPLAIRTFENNVPGERLKYFATNEVFLVISIGIVILVEWSWGRV